MKDDPETDKAFGWVLEMKTLKISDCFLLIRFKRIKVTAILQVDTRTFDMKL